MLNKYNRYKVLKVFLDSPTESFRLREISRISKIAPLSVMNYLKEFEKEELIRKYIQRGIPFYQSSRDNEKFILYKKISIIYELDECGLIEFIWEKLAPEAIILYGSFSKGESTENSDIDLFLICKDKEIDLKEFEKKLNRSIHLMFNSNPEKIPKELKNNLINGIVLKGYFKAI